MEEVQCLEKAATSSPNFELERTSLLSHVASAYACNPDSVVSEHPFNRVGYKYNCALADPLLKYSEFHERTVLPESTGPTILNPIDANPFLTFSDDMHAARTNKGWCSVRGSSGVKVIFRFSL